MGKSPTIRTASHPVFASSADRKRELKREDREGDFAKIFTADKPGPDLALGKTFLTLVKNWEAAQKRG